MKNLFFFTLILSLTTNASDILSLKGVVDSIKEQKAIFRTATEDITVDLSVINQKTKNNLIDEKNKRKAITILVDKDAIVDRKKVPMGVRADCSEIPTDMNELEDIAKNSNDMLDFLKKIPGGSLQGFTFVTNSLSLHRGKKDANGEGQVSPMWPRVLRSSIDGKITVSFVCDPKNPTFGKVEIIHFDDKEKEFKTTEFDFGHPNGIKTSPEERIHNNPISCISCHAGSQFNGKPSLKPNWPEYFQWSDCMEDRGIQFYGGNDDNMGTSIFRSKGNYENNCSAELHQKMTSKEQNDYKKFKDFQKNNECFNTLPWANKSKDNGSFESSWAYDYYPYSGSAQEKFSDPLKPENKDIFNYSLKTNLRFTDTYSHLMAQRNANLLKKNPEYDKIKYLIAMEAARCFISPADEQKVMKAIPDFKMGSVKGLVGTPILASFAKYAGLKDLDWTMEFQEKNKSNYVSAMPNEGPAGAGDLRINNVVGGEVLKDIAKYNPIIAKVAEGKISRGVTKVFGEKFSCIDDLGGRVYPERNNSGVWGTQLEAYCKTLKEENDKNLDQILDKEKLFKKCLEPTTEVSIELKEMVDIVVKKFSAEQIVRGKKLVELDSKGKCVMCHSTSTDILPKNFRFVPSELDKNKEESKAILFSRKDEIAEKLEDRLINTKTMPPMENQLTNQDREDIKAYLLSISAEK